MKCAEFSKIVHELARSRGLTKTEAAVARAHAKSCPPCARQLAEAEELAAILKGVSAESRSLGASESTETSLMAAFRASKAEGSPRWKPRWQPVLAWAGGAAAALLLGFATLGRTPVYRSSAVAPSNSSSAPTAASAKTTDSQLAAQSQNAAAEPVSGFVPVPFSGGFAQGDSGEIVRVQVPRTALAELGYPVDEVQGQGMVQADLLVGEDGWPRAVRIVKESADR